MIELHNVDCMTYMAGLEDNAFELAIVDPPYFARAGKASFRGFATSSGGVVRTPTESRNWEVPDGRYFAELMRVSKNQIIWGCNYYAKYIPHVGRIVWDKENDAATFSKCEIASQSFCIRVDMYRYKWNGMLQGDMKNKERRIHPTQKPVKLYEWLLKNYAKPGDRILDTHLGSGSSAIAAHYGGFDFVGCELDPDYFKAAQKRFNDETRQVAMF